jgi:hypothetical protein
VTLPADIHRCRGLGTESGQPDASCLDCERRIAGIADYLAGRRCWWMPVPTEQPCPEKLEGKK